MRPTRRASTTSSESAGPRRRSRGASSSTPSSTPARSATRSRPSGADGLRLQIAFRASERRPEPEVQRDDDLEDAHDRVHERDVAGPLDGESSDERAERRRRPGEDPGDGDDPTEHVIRHYRLPQAPGVDVEEDAEAAAEPPHREGDPERRGERHHEGGEPGEDQRAERDIAEAQAAA